MAERRQRRERAGNAERRRRQLVEATLRSVVRHGLSRTTLATVSEEAGLSQGVAVFYFGRKETLLVEALRSLYDEYRALFRAALADAGPGPAARVAALVRADFDPSVCNPDALAVWHAFWGEAGARPLYAEVAAEGDAERQAAMESSCVALAVESGRTSADGRVAARIVDATIDGLWLAIHLEGTAPDLAERQAVVTRALLELFPGAAEALRNELGEPA